MLPANTIGEAAVGDKRFVATNTRHKRKNTDGAFGRTWLLPRPGSPTTRTCGSHLVATSLFLLVPPKSPSINPACGCRPDVKPKKQTKRDLSSRAKNKVESSTMCSSRNQCASRHRSAPCFIGQTHDQQARVRRTPVC